MRQQPFASPGEALEHFGVKGMKWGVRKDNSSKPELTGLIKEDITRTTSNGDEFTLSRNPPTLLDKTMAKLSKKSVTRYNESAFLSIKDKNGDDIGQTQIWQKGKDELYINWVDIDKSQRGKGYATAVLKSVDEQARQLGMKKMTLEVPGIAPDARHIYEQMGFKVTQEPKTTRDIWGGLTSMEKRFD